MGDINSHLKAYEQSMSQSAPSKATFSIANSMFVLLIRGMFNNFTFPYIQLPCNSLSGDQLYHPFWEAVGRIELCGLKVLALTGDGLAANRKFFKLHNLDGKSIVYKTANPYANDRQLFFFSDPPHLIKTVRNGWANNKRRLWVRSKNVMRHQLLLLL